jgi:hypothetical protein
MYCRKYILTQKQCYIDGKLRFSSTSPSNLGTCPTHPRLSPHVALHKMTKIDQLTHIHPGDGNSSVAVTLDNFQDSTLLVPESQSFTLKPNRQSLKSSISYCQITQGHVTNKAHLSIQNAVLLKT